MSDRPELPYKRRHRQRTEQENQAHRDREESQRQEDKARVRRSIARHIIRLRRQYEAAQKEQSKLDKKKRCLDIFTFFAVVVTAGLTGLTYYVFYQQLGEMRKVYDPIKASADATKTAAEATKSQAELQARQAELSIVQVSARMRLDDYKIYPIDKDHKFFKNGSKVREAGELVPRADRDISGWFVSPVWKNTGSTEARNVIAYWFAYVSPVHVGPNDCPTLASPDPPPPPMIAAPGGTIVGQTRFLKIEDVRGAMSKPPKEDIFLLGAVEYNDIFPGTPLHHFEWCVHFNPNDITRSIFSPINVYEKAD